MTEALATNVPVLVFGTTVTALGALRAFARRRRTVWTHAAPGDVSTFSRYYRPLPLPDGFDPAASHEEQLRSILDSLPFDRAFLLPCTDLWTNAAASLPENLRLRYPACIAPVDAIQTLNDKGRLATRMAELDLPHPRSYLVDRERDLAAIDARVFDSGFLKPKSSPEFIRRFGTKGFFVHSRAEAITRLRAVQANGFEVILQEYIPGPPTAHFFIDGFMDRHGMVGARFARQRIRMYPPDFGNSTFMVSVSIDTVQPAMDTLESLLRSLSYRGIFSAEFKQDPRDGRFHLIEVNARPWWYVGFAESCGVHVCELAYADALGLPLPHLHPYPVGKTCVYPQMDFREYRWQRQHGSGHQHNSLLTRVGPWLLAHKAVFALDDPWPAMRGSWSALRRRIGERVPQFLDKTRVTEAS